MLREEADQIISSTVRTTRGEEGHWKRECPKKNTNKPSSSANVATKPHQPLVLTASTQDQGKEWIMDSGCSFHLTPNKEILSDLKEFNGGKVIMANNSHSEVKGIGKIQIQNPDGFVVILKDVRYMPHMSRNLISYGMLEKSGCTYEGSEFMVNFYKDGKKVTSGKYHEGLYYLQGTVVKAEKSVPEAETDEYNIAKAEYGVRMKKSKTRVPPVQGGGWRNLERVKEFLITSQATIEKSRQEEPDLVFVCGDSTVNAADGVRYRLRQEQLVRINWLPEDCRNQLSCESRRREKRSRSPELDSKGETFRRWVVVALAGGGRRRTYGCGRNLKLISILTIFSPSREQEEARRRLVEMIIGDGGGSHRNRTLGEMAIRWLCRASRKGGIQYPIALGLVVYINNSTWSPHRA
ncbi:hypothetical protein ISN45_Aa08g030180 [Arabidopsis thaliana x Arabidopsis arenosa]|uniref:Retrovirus-related Pol polyprotein from transposon TNT 1-94-like beta-barrel domain-containing protein n=1 Tax=Arabidopsis thaliana x Arabidopsis arenosa TaxID=1240361 RepID=A0A8T1XV18_9BRAS|nr:hypothetical protein ISN45_Aa08g030180 [Arabidopsis thaliana x Arabidopsis arenosa]